MSNRPLSELVDTSDPAWPMLLDLVSSATNNVEILSVDRIRGEDTLRRIQVTTRSPMGAIAYECGGLLIDHGWIRVLGGGHPRLPRDLATWNHGANVTGAFLVADDVLGGFFAFNGSVLPGPTGNVHYFAPDTLDWEDLDCGYTDFFNFLLLGDLAKFYENHRWPSWQEDVSQLAGDLAFSIQPFLWAEGPQVSERSRRPVPISELWVLQQDIRRQLLDQDMT